MEDFEHEETPHPGVCVCMCVFSFFWVKNLLQLIMESTAWCVVWFGFPNEDWIHPQSLTVRRAEYAALQPVSMEILRSCSVFFFSPPLLLYVLPNSAAS